MRVSAGVFAAFMAMAASTEASALSITVTSISGVWRNATTFENGTVAGNNTSSIFWGAPTIAGGSSYVFDPLGAGTPPIGPISPGQIVSLGTVTHNNFPITSPQETDLDTALLEVVIGFTLTGAGPNPPTQIGAQFQFQHNETPNNGSPCAAGGSQPCPDEVIFTGSTTILDNLIVNGQPFSIELVGLLDANNQIVQEFLTLENQANTARLQFRFNGTEVPAIPLPATAFLLAGALAGFGVFRRRAA